MKNKTALIHRGIREMENSVNNIIETVEKSNSDDFKLLVPNQKDYSEVTESLNESVEVVEKIRQQLQYLMEKLNELYQRSNRK
jgi:prefoldin subunit 5